MKNSSKNITISKIRVFLKENYRLVLLFSLLSCINAIFLYWNFRSYNLSLGIKFAVVLIASLVIEISACTLLFFAKKNQWKIEKIFLIFGLSVGIFYIFALPMGCAPDEGAHFFRIYEITSGHLVSEKSGDQIGSIEPANVRALFSTLDENNTTTYAMNFSSIDLYANEDETIFNDTSAGGYNPISYIPQIIGVAIGRILHLPLLAIAYLGRIFNLVACVTIFYFCIKYIPFMKKLVLFLAFLPITMQSMASLSADGLVIASSVSLISFVLYTTYGRTAPLTRKHYFLIFAVCLLLTVSKIVYAPLCFLLFSIPRKRFGGIKPKLITIFSIGIITATIALIWFILPPSGENPNSAIQISYILNHPLGYSTLVAHTAIYYAPDYITNLLGGTLEWYTVRLSLVYLLPSFVIFVLLCAKARTTAFVNRSFKIISIAAAAIITPLIFTAMFISWSKPGLALVDGVQGRYFLEIVLTIPVAFLPIKSQTSIKKTKAIALPKFTHNYYLYGFLVFESVYALTTIMCSHL